MSKVAKKNFGLGKGLESLFGSLEVDTNVSRETPIDTLISLDINKIRPNVDQPRKYFDDESLEELSQSISAQGIIQPLIVEDIGGDNYLIIAGERRYRAAKLAGLIKVPVIIREVNKLSRAEIAILENIQRENLNPIDEAFAYQYLINESSLTQEDLSKRLGKKRSTIANSLRLLQLDEKIQDDIITKTITAGHARAILSLVNVADRMLLRDKIIEGNLSVRQAEEKAQAYNNGNKIAGKPKKKTKDIDFVLKSAEDNIIKVFQTKVELKGNAKKGKIVLSYVGEKELERIYTLLTKEKLEIN